MRRRFWFGPLPLVCGLAMALAASAGCKGCNGKGTLSGTGSTGTGSGSGTGTGSTDPKFICPRVLYADFKTYRSWYAQECPSLAWVNLNTTKSNAASCPGTGTDCVEFTKGRAMLRRGVASGVYHHEPGLESGIVKASKSMITCPPISIPTGFSITMEKETHAYLETSAGGPQIFVMLYRVKVGGASIPTQTFGVGIEVTDDPGAGAPVIAHGQVVQPVFGKVCNLQHPAGGDEYQIVVDTGTTIGP